MPHHRRTHQPAQHGQRATERRRGCKDRKPSMRTRGGLAARFAIECGLEPVATWKHDRCRGVHAFHVAPRRGLSSWTPRPYRGRRIGEAAQPGPPATAADVTQRRERKHHDRRIGEADHPGPDSEAANRRQRALHALAQMQLLPPDPRPAALRDHQAETDAAETLSDTLSSTTPFASMRGDFPATLGSGGTSGASGTRRGDAGLHAATFARAAASHACSRC